VNSLCSSAKLQDESLSEDDRDRFSSDEALFFGVLKNLLLSFFEEFIVLYTFESGIISSISSST
jgi:hypothetical protein